MADVLLRVIDEFADGFLVLDGQRHVLFFNDALLRTTGLHAQDILSGEVEFVRNLGVLQGGRPMHIVEIPGRNGSPRRYMVSVLEVEGVRGQYFLVRLKPTPQPQEAPGRQDWEDLVSNIGDPVLTVNLSGDITCANPSFRRLVGYETGDTLPNISDIYIHPAELEDKLARLAESGSVFNLETHVATRGRDMRRVLDTSWVMRDETGSVTGYTCLLKDVTYVKNLEARLKISERNYIVLFDTILSSILIVDPLGRILNCNYSAEQLYGYPWAEIVGKEFDEVFRVHRKSPALADIIKSAERTGGRHVETDVPRRCKDGTIRFTYASYSALVSSSGETIAWSVMERDLTERVRLEKKLQESFQQIKETQSAAILGFARLTEYRDKETGKHLERIREYTRVLGTALARLPKYSDYITDDYIEDLCLSSVLHDVGKVGIEDAILQKPGRLVPEEFERIKQHARLGGEALRAVDGELRRESFLTIGKEIAYYHHERWDGSGYPTGRRGEQIPLSARIVAIADVYDALTSKRTYKDPLPHEEAVQIIVAERGTHFDPEIVDVFLQVQETFHRIRMLEDFRLHPEAARTLTGTGTRVPAAPAVGPAGG